MIPPPPPFLFLIVGLVASAGALITLFYYQKLSHQNTPTQPTEPETPKVKEKEIEKALQPILEENNKLKQKLAKAETFFKDLKVSRRLAPEPNQQTNNKQEEENLHVTQQ